MSLNYKNLHKARHDGESEFFTMPSTIQKELKHYKDHFKNKIILCNANDGMNSEFWKYFYDLFFHLKLKKLIGISYGNNANSFEYDGNKITRMKLKGDGGFESEESIEYLKKANIVVTNPPFPLFVSFLHQLMKFEKKFIIIGNVNAVSYPTVFRYFMNNELWWGYSPRSIVFKIKNGEKKVNAVWYTNITHSKRNKELPLYKKYIPEKYLKYDSNAEIINVDKVSDIPLDFPGVMGVPLTFLSKWCPNQFRIVGKLGDETCNDVNWGDTRINGKKRYVRLLIKRVSSH